jgi:hypothetical protein
MYFVAVVVAAVVAVVAAVVAAVAAAVFSCLSSQSPFVMSSCRSVKSSFACNALHPAASSPCAPGV